MNNVLHVESWRKGQVVPQEIELESVKMHVRTRRNVIIVEGDTSTSDRLVSALMSHTAREEKAGSGIRTLVVDYSIYKTKDEFFNSNPADWDLVVTASHLADGSGFDVLSFVQGLRPDVPVILTGYPDEAGTAVEAIRAGAADYLLVTGHESVAFPVTVQKCLALQTIRSENDALHADLSHSLSELAVANRELQLMIQRLEVAARTDDLTKLSNRRWLNLMLENRWEESNRNGVPLGFMMIDLDGFKSLNDKLGHQKGDEILRLAARVLEANCRSIDVSARFGGDEFCVLMPHADPDSTMRVANRISTAFDEAVASLKLFDTCVSMSIGISHWDISTPINADELVRHADVAMYKAKSSDHSKIILYECEMREAG